MTVRVERGEKCVRVYFKEYIMVRSTPWIRRPVIMYAQLGRRRRLHVDMWEHETGMEIPPGYIVHHIDWDKTHNEISNLALVSFKEHNLIHNPPPVERQTDEEKEIIKKLKGLGLIS